jgi:hypothetical protein
VLAVLDEAAALAAMASRTGATIVPTLCTAWVGGELGAANADGDRHRHVAAGGYALGLVVGAQPLVVAELLRSAELGLPGRMIWLAARDRSIPDAAPAWPGRLDIQLPPLSRWPDGRISPIAIEVDAEVAREVRAHHLARSRGEVEVPALDAHRSLAALKVAALLAALDGRCGQVTPADWSLAGVVLDVSAAVRGDVIAGARADAVLAERSQIGRQVRREAASEDATTTRAAHRMARAIRRRIDQTGAPLVERDARHATAGRDRAVVTLADAVGHGVGMGWLRRLDGGLIGPGRVAP